jgi:hypothetical protein
VNLVGQDELRRILNENSPKVKEIVLGYPRDYDTKSIEEADRAPLMTSQLPVEWIGRGAGYDFESEPGPEPAVKIITLRSPA